MRKAPKTLNSVERIAAAGRAAPVPGTEAMGRAVFRIQGRFKTLTAGESFSVGPQAER